MLFWILRNGNDDPHYMGARCACLVGDAISTRRTETFSTLTNTVYLRSNVRSQQ